MLLSYEVEELVLNRWADTGLSSQAITQLVRLEEIAYCLKAVSHAVEADEQSSRAAERCEVDYVMLPPLTRKELRVASQVLQVQLQRALRSLHKTLVKDGASS
jgi:hypothetical protein